MGLEFLPVKIGVQSEIDVELHRFAGKFVNISTFMAGLPYGFLWKNREYDTNDDNPLDFKHTHISIYWRNISTTAAGVDPIE